MPGGYLFGWDPVGEDWVKVVCNPDGELDIDATAIFENPPTEDEAAKGPSSEWAFDHDADVAAHHARYTDVESRGAIDDIFNASGVATRGIDLDHNFFYNSKQIHFRESILDSYYIAWYKFRNYKSLRLICYEVDVGYENLDFELYRTDHYVKVIHDDSFQTALALYLEEAPTNGVINKAPTSNWAFDHDADAAAHHAKYTDAEAIAAAAVYENPPTENEALKAPTSEWAFDHDANVSAHHAKYTDAEAIAACGLDGDLYHTIPGIDFKPDAPDTVQHTYLNTGSLRLDDDNATVYCGVKLPDGVVVTAVKVDGNILVGNETWTMYRVALSDRTTVSMATSSVASEDTTISVPTIDNSLYAYFITATSLNTSNEIYSARIKFTL